MRPGRRPVLFLALGLVLLSALQLAYRATLPTDGWSVITSDAFDYPDWIYWENLVGVPSLLIKGDTLVAVDGQPVSGTASVKQLPPPTNLKTGNQSLMTVTCEGQNLTGFFRRKYDAQQMLAQFAQTTQDEVELETLTAGLQRVVEETMQPESASLRPKPVTGRRDSATKPTYH